MRRWADLCWVVAAAGLACNGAMAAGATEETALRDLRVRLLGSERLRVPDAEWRATMAAAERLENQAAQQGDPNAALTIREIRARALALVAGDALGAVELLRRGRERYGRAAPVAARQATVAEGEILARLGDAAAIRRLMDEFRAAPYYDGAPFRYTVHEGRDTPITILRPRGGPENSITLTALGRLLRRANAAPGAQFPDFTLTDSEGRTLSAADWRGRATIVVFWLANAAESERLLREIAGIIERRSAERVTVVAICLDRSGEELKALTSREPLRRWRNVPRESAQPLAARLGLFGESEVFVLDAQGLIVERGVTGSDLAVAVDRALAVR